MPRFRTDIHNNPAAFTTDIAKQGGLIEGTDYTRGMPFTDGGRTLYTASLLGDAISLTIRVIDKIGFYTKGGVMRWVYIGIPKFIWDTLSQDEKRRVIGFMYQHEGGKEMKPLFSAPSP